MAASVFGDADQTTGGAGAKSARELLKLPVPFVAPRTRLETQIAAAFSDVLRVEPIGRDDEFYDLGGDSLAGEALSIEIERATGKPFPISKLFKHGTPAAIAGLLGDASPLHEAQDVRFFIVHGRGGYTALKPEFRAGLAPDRNVTMFELPGIRGGRRPIWRISTLAAEYVRQMQAEQPEGPLKLAAFCSGSFIALEMAAILERQGRPLDRLVLIDPLAPRQLLERHVAELELERDPKAMTAHGYWRRTGRWRGNRLLDMAAVMFGQWREARVHLEDIRNQKLGFAIKYKNSGFADWPRALLVAMYRFAWPPPYKAKVVILASEERAREVSRPNGIWRRFTPNVAIGIVTRHHADLGKGEAGKRTAQMLEHAMMRPRTAVGGSADRAPRAPADSGT